MPDISERLRTVARSAAEARGHRLFRFEAMSASQTPARQSYEASCMNAGCQAFVQVDPVPPANGIDIGGSAVALDCPVRAGR